MFFFFLFFSFSRLLLSKELVDGINRSPGIKYRASLNTRFVNFTVLDVRKFLSPIKPLPNLHKSASQIGTSERYTDIFSSVVTGMNGLSGGNFNGGKFSIPVFDVTSLCSTWATAVTSAVSISVSRWNKVYVDFSLQYIFDCADIEPCSERGFYAAYSSFFGNVPLKSQWGGSRVNYNNPPPSGTFANCRSGTFPGFSHSDRSPALASDKVIYLANWRMMKVFLWEVGAITSSIIVHPSFFAYSGGVYHYNSSIQNDEPLGTIDVTIIGYGKEVDGTKFWWVVPHFGTEFGIEFSELENNLRADSNACTKAKEGSEFECTPEFKSTIVPNGLDVTDRGLVKYIRRVNDCLIESMSAGAYPINFNSTLGS